MKVMKEVEVSDEEVNRVIVEKMFRDARDEFNELHINDNFTSFYTFDGWRKLEYEKAINGRK